MKQTGIVATLLIFLSLLLVLSATVFFLLQGRQELRANVVRLQAEVEGQSETIVQFQSTAAAREMELATNRAMMATRELELAQHEEAFDSLAATREAELVEQAREQPLVKIIKPLSGDEVSAGEPLEIVVVAGYSEGFTNMRLQVGSRPITFQDDGEAFRVFTHRAVTLPDGPLTITATVTTESELSASDVITVTVLNSSTEIDDGAQIVLLHPAAVAILPR